MRYSLRTLLILMAAAPPVLAGAWHSTQRRTKCTYIGAARCQIGLLSDAAAAFAIAVGELPPDLDALIAPPPDLANPMKWSGPYLEKDELPRDPWNNAFQYELLDPHTKRFRIWSKGADGVSRTRDDIVAVP